MENTKSAKNIKKNNQKIVKLNWKKIVLIVFLVVIIISGISVGLYFAIRPARSPMPSNITWEKKEKKLEKDFDKHGSDGIVGIYFGANDSDETELSLYGELGIPEDQQTLSGPFSVYLDELPNNDTIKWYGLQEESSSDVSQDIEEFFYDGENEYGEPQVKWDQAIYLGNASNGRLNDLDNNGWNQVDISYVPETIEEGESDYDDNDYELAFYGNGASVITPSAPSWFWFRDGELIAITSNIETTTDDNDELQLGDVDQEYFNEIEKMIVDEELYLKP